MDSDAMHPVAGSIDSVNLCDLMCQAQQWTGTWT